MNNRKEFEERLEKHLQSLDGLKRAEPSPWFYNRVMSRLSREETTIWERLSRLISRPAVAFASLCLILVVNGYFLFAVTETRTAQNEIPTESESILAISSSFDYENLAP